ncbi:MAG: preprotein translocase subunit SecY, partial [Candidatus Marinimicrobia bacterium]|nr:preprotein translocase subunit SecY [Candidatus Neomarinimicrobiota bacterium]
MINKIQSIFVIPELRSRILFTVSLLIVVRVGAHIPIPGVDGEALAGAFT